MDSERMQQEVKVPGFLRLSKVISYVLYAWVLIGVISLLMRVFLLLFSANPSTPFVEFVYNLSADYLNPFRGIFPAKTISDTGYLDVAALFAIMVYLFVLWGFSALIHYVQFKIDKSVQEQKQQIALMEADKRRAEANAAKAAQTSAKKVTSAR